MIILKKGRFENMETKMYISRKNIQGIRSISMSQFKKIPLKEIKKNNRIVLISTSDVKEIEKIKSFFEMEYNPEADYSIAVSENKQICYALAARSEIITKKWAEEAVKYAERGDLYQFCCKMKEKGLYGEGVLFDDDILEELAQQVSIETGEVLKKTDIYLFDYCKKFDKIYIYGAGYYGRKCIESMKRIGISVTAIIETQKTIEQVEGIPVHSFDSIEFGINDAIILALKKDFCFQVFPLIAEKGIHNYCVYPFWM